MNSFLCHSHARGRTAAPAGSRLLLAALLLTLGAGTAFAQNAIVTENLLSGTSPIEWELDNPDAGNLSIQGFATDISVNQGETVRFKIKTDAAAYTVKIYRLGWYQGLGARHQGDAVITATLPQAQPADLFDPVTGLTDCGNWAESAHWDVPVGAVSGIYLAKLTRTDTNGASHIAFIVRDDASTSDLLFKTSDATWQAYNGYGGNSLYVGGATGPPALNHASKVSYNRPFYTRGGGGGSGSSEDWLFNSEYPMVRWLERNGYDVTYTTDVDADRNGQLIANHAVFLSVGHDEYWSAQQRAYVTAARDAGTHLAFFSGNEVYWKTRWEPSIDGSGTPYRTLVCYKEGTLGENVCGGKCDPLAGVWTGLWRDGCPPTYGANDGCDPENALTGQISWDGTTSAIRVPAAYGSHRFWRNTSIAALGPSQEAVLGPSTLGYEWDFQQYDGFYPGGRMLLSQTDHNGKRHHLSLYRHAGGALVFGAGTVQWSWGLDDTHDRGSDPALADMQQATVNLFADMGVQPATLQAGLLAAAASADVTPPVTTITSPANGGNVQSGQQTVITGTASDAGGGVVALVEVSVDGGTTWRPASGTDVWSFAWTPGATGPATVMSRGFDDTGNLESPGPTVNVTVDPRVCPCTVFSPASVPANIDEPDTNPIEVGVKFSTTVDGEITGVRFYKSAANTGAHVGNLWTSAGVNLATTTFSGESASGWQEATFAAPVAITANTTYIASYHSTTGHYSQDFNAFTSAVDAPPLRVLADGEDGVNGVYSYSAVSTFPTQGFQASNYWVDVVFDDNPGPDVTPPTVLSRVPSSGASGVAVGTTVSAQFNEPIDPATVDGTTFALMDDLLAPVAAVVTYSAATRTATLMPSAPLAYSTTYTATLRGGGADPRIKDLAGNALAADAVWSFTTSTPPPPPPTEGPGGPILLISHAANPFGRYVAEILRTEGFNAFSAKDISIVTPAVTDSYDVVILGEMALTAGQVTMLSDWTDAGGTLIAMRPDAQLAPLLGLAPAAGTLSEGYLLVDTGSGPGVGIVGQTIQFHGTADLYTLSGATAIATLYSDATTATPNPAVTTHAVGSNGGQAVAFAYDLARSVVYTRQGNPAWAGQERDGVAPLRPDDMFFGNAAGDPQTDWIDLDKVAIPQADEQQRLLANIVLQGNLDVMPLPRFWYLPSGHKAAIVMTGDNHGDAGMAPRFDLYVNESAPGCSVDDWECVRATGYMYIGSSFTPAQAQFYHDLGFEVAMHVNTGCASYTGPQFQDFIDNDLDAFATKYPTLPIQHTNRNHCIAWSGWSLTPEVQAANGIRFDTNYYYWPGSWIQNRSGMFTGSGMPMRFAQLDGTIVDCFQATTQMTDESGQTYPSFCDQLLDRATGAEGYYGVFTTNMHFDQANHAGSNAIVASAQARGVPVVSAKQMLDWLDGRNGSSFANMSWNGNVLSFDVAVATGALNLRGMLPTLAAVGSLTGITEDSVPIAYTTETIKGIEYAIFPANTATYAASYAVDTTPPLISNVVAAPGGSGTTATIAWDTDENAGSRVDYGTSAGSLTLSETDPALTGSHSVELTSLTRGVTYYYRVTSEDPSTNSATEPEPPAPPLDFTTPVPCPADVTLADFQPGTPDANTALVLEDDGEVVLAPTLGAEFDGMSLPADWSSAAFAGGGTVVVSNGRITVDGAHAYTNSAFGPILSLEFVATYSAGQYQNVGFSADQPFGASPWIVIGQGLNTTGVFARNDLGQEISLGAGLLGTPHRYRVDWNANSFDFHVDGVLVATINQTVGAGMFVQVSDVPVGGAQLLVDWLRVTPYAASGSFTSRVFDMGGPTSWGAATWTADTPAGTGVSLLVRTGDTAVPDGSWTAFNPVSNGGAVGGNSQYLQYRADLSTAAPGWTPVLRDVAIACAPGVDLTPPVITNVVATPAPDGLSATITWDTDEAADSRVDYGPSGGAPGSNVSSATLVTSHSIVLPGLTPGVSYDYRVTSADASLNSTTEPVPPAVLSFTTPAQACFTDDTEADFGAGTTSNTAVTVSDDGEVTLAPALQAEFAGASLPAGWASYDWPFDPGSGVLTVSGGLLTLDGMRANPEPFATGPGVSLEFDATFSGQANQHIGFGGGNHLPPDEVYNVAPWAMFSTQTGGVLRARTNGPSAADVTIPGSWLGAPHRYRIDWGASTVDFHIDGTLVHSQAVAIAGPMRPAASDLTVGDGVITVDWVRMAPYAASGTFTSRIHDAGAPATWDEMSWTASTPAGTGLALFARTGDTPAPDGSWTAFTAVPSSGSVVGGTSRYIQYRADLTTSDPNTTAVLEAVSIACVACDPTPPPAVADLVVARATGGGGGRIPVTVTFTAPAEAAIAEVWRAPFGGYPDYDDGGGTTPATPSYPPASPWTLTAVTTSGQTDDPPSRDAWHYVVFTKSACGVVSDVSNVSAGLPNYLLGDVTDGVTECGGDNAVTTADVSLLGSHYGQTLAGGEGWACLDVGPTEGGSVSGRPLTDRVLQFEDLVMFALNFGAPGISAGPARAVPAARAASDHDELTVDAPTRVAAGGTFDVAVHMSGAGDIQALSVALVWNAAIAEPIGVAAGDLLESQGGVLFSPGPGRLDAALLGARTQGLAGEGTLAVWTFRALSAGDPAIGLADVDARDARNRRIALGEPGPRLDTPAVTAFERVSPNPFAGSAALAFSLASPGDVSLTIYSVDGRRVRTLARGAFAAGRHQAVWDGADGSGRRAGPGLYFARLEYAGAVFTRSLVLMR